MGFANSLPRYQNTIVLVTKALTAFIIQEMTKAVSAFVPATP